MTSLQVALPAGGSLDALARTSNLPPFGAPQQGFAAALARQLTTSAATRAHPELVSLGFWLRAANVARLAQAFASAHAGRLHLPRGLVFHVAPSNVDTIFVYSWFVSLLCGNRNVIRISSRESVQTRALLDVLRTLLADPQWHEIAARTLVVRYGHEAEITRELCARCDVRVVWGGDETIRSLRAFALAPHATELAFSNKFSLSVLDAASVLACEPAALDRLGHAFYNDAYWFGQMACSSPRMVFWLGGEDDVRRASERFWPAVGRALDAHDTEIAPADSVSKEVAVDSLAIEQAGVRIDTRDPRMTLAWMAPARIRDELHCGAGLFHEARIGRLAELEPHLTRKVQTVSQFGVPASDWQAFLSAALPQGIDRIVPVGHALDFGPVWDGFDLIASFLREVSIVAEAARA